MAVKSIFDQIGDKITFKFPPQRIISLVPSQTELLADIGLDSEVIGVTKFCVHPASWVEGKTIVGGTKNFRFDIIDKLNPDLIIGNKEENYREGILKLKERHPVWMSDITFYEEALAMIDSIGELTNRKSETLRIKNTIERAFLGLAKRKPASVLYMIWRNPWMAAANNTFINAILEKMGLENCLSGRQRYPELSNEEISEYAPEIIFLSSEPFPFREAHIEELKAITPASKIILVDGEMFSWYGSRLALLPAYANALALS